MTIRLRGHHLLCLLTYRGVGYSDTFVANLDRVAARLTGGEAVEIVAGPDDVCEPLCAADDGMAAHCHLRRTRARDRAALGAVSAVLGRGLAVGDAAAGDALVLDPETVARLRAAFAAGTIRAACTRCPWDGLCTQVAEAGFAGTRLHPVPGSAQ